MVKKLIIDHNEKGEIVSPHTLILFLRSTK